MPGMRAVSPRSLFAFFVPTGVAILLLLLYSLDAVFLGLLTGVGVLAIGLPALLYLAGCIYSLITRKLRAALSLLVALSVSWVLLAYHQPPNAKLFESIIISAFEVHDHSDCIKRAVEWANGKKIGVCDKHVLLDGDVRTFIYDSSDQLLLPPDRRSAEWQEAVQHLFPEVGLTYPTVHARLSDHLYYVVFDVSSVR
jgi:hypothetical protein